MILLGFSAFWLPAVGQGTLVVPVGHSETLEATEIPETVIVGRSEIADVTIAGQTVILTAMEVGRTNLILLDDEGRELLRTAVEVVPLDRRRVRDIRVIEGGSDEDGVRYLCGPKPGCVVLQEGEQGSDRTAEAGQDEEVVPSQPLEPGQIADPSSSEASAQ